MSKIILPQIFQNSMLLQRRKAICIWGAAQGCAEVTITLGEEKAQAIVENGQWKVYLPPMEAAENLSLKITGSGCTAEINDIAIGEVWLAGGQSNMEFLLKHEAHAESACKLQNLNIRCYEVPKIAFPGQEEHYKMSEAGFWRKASPHESPYFTAVGFYFAQLLNSELNVPVGIINCTWGGTSASCWVSENYLTGSLSFYLDKATKYKSEDEYNKQFAFFIEMQKIMQSKVQSGEIDMGKSNLEPMKPMLDPAKREEFMAMHGAPFSPFRPCGLFEMMLKTIIPYTVSGVIWYQGESDEYYAEHYEKAMTAVVNCWRDNWKEALPFILVQLASFEIMSEYQNFTPVRRAQEIVAKTCPGVYLVTAMDLGMQYDIHPKDKKSVGRRLALQALDKIYHRHLLADSPTVLSAQKNQDELTILMKHTGKGLCVKGETPETFDVKADGKEVKGFAVTVNPHSITVKADCLRKAEEIEVAFCQRAFCGLNIYSSANLPVLPFVYCYKAE